MVVLQHSWNFNCYCDREQCVYVSFASLGLGLERADLGHGPGTAGLDCKTAEDSF